MSSCILFATQNELVSTHAKRLVSQGWLLQINLQNISTYTMQRGFLEESETMHKISVIKVELSCSYGRFRRGS